MSAHVCSHRDCFRPAPHGLGWGLSTGMVQWFCPAHLPAALVRLAGLLEAARSATRTPRARATKAA